MPRQPGAGQDAQVTVTVRTIKERELPEPDDEFAQLASEFDTIDELRADLREKVLQTKRSRQSEEIRNATSLIRLITRLIFCWFIKEKGLIPDDLFHPEKFRQLFKDLSPKESTYYKAILQNLFFATLNQEMGKREFRKRTKQPGGRDQHYLITNLYRYEALLRDPAQALKLFSGIPFLNGGLFECLDKELEEKGTRRVIRIDGFADRNDNVIRIRFFPGGTCCPR